MILAHYVLNFWLRTKLFGVIWSNKHGIWRKWFSAVWFKILKTSVSNFDHYSLDKNVEKWIVQKRKYFCLLINIRQAFASVRPVLPDLVSKYQIFSLFWIFCSFLCIFYSACVKATLYEFTFRFIVALLLSKPTQSLAGQLFVWQCDQMKVCKYYTMHFQKCRSFKALGKG